MQKVGLNNHLIGEENGFSGSPAVTRAVANNFIPELWSDEVIGAYKSNLVMANVVTKLSHKGKKGDNLYPCSSKRCSTVKSSRHSSNIKCSY